MFSLKQSLWEVPRKKVFLRFENVKGDEWYIDDDDDDDDDDKNIQEYSM